MSENFLKYIYYVLTGLFIGGYVIFDAGLKHENGLFITIGIVLMAFVGTITLIRIIILRKVVKQAKEELVTARQNFRDDSKQIRVDLNKIDLRKVLRTDKIPEVAYNFPDSDNMEDNENLNAYLIEINEGGVNINYPIKTERDMATLTLLLLAQKETILYMGKTDNQIVYLDLEFLAQN